MIALMKKDFLLMRSDLKQLIPATIMILVVIGMNMPEICYLIFTITLVWGILLSVSDKEKKSKGLGLLVASPLSRERMIAGRYATILVMYGITTVIYGVLSFIFQAVGFFPALTIRLLAAGFFLVSLFGGITIPLYQRLSHTAMSGISLLLIYVGAAFYQILVRRGIVHLDSPLFQQAMELKFLVGGIVILAISYQISKCLARTVEY